MTDGKLSLAELIEQLKGDIIDVQSQENEMFSLAEVTINSKFVVETTASGGGKANFWVLTINADSAHKSQFAHEVTIKLQPIKPMFLGNKGRKS